MSTRFMDEPTKWTSHGIPFCCEGVVQRRATQSLFGRAGERVLSPERVSWTA